MCPLTVELEAELWFEGGWKKKDDVMECQITERYANNDDQGKSYDV